MSFSLSAPVFTPADEKQEQASLTDAEKEQIRRDLYGDTNGDESMPSDTQEVQKVLLSIPTESKTSYLEALSNCPDLVVMESNPSNFLHCEDGDPEAAARRLVEYWKYRHNLFGELAFLPLTSAGALRDDLDTLHSGAWEHLPDDQEGRAVIFYNRNKVEQAKNMTRESILRVMWYVVNKILQDEPGRTKGIVFVADMRCLVGVKTFDRKLDRRKVDVCSRILPIKVRALHICCSTHRSVLDFVCPVFKRIAGRYMRSRLVLHHGEATDLLASLEEYGLDGNGLPPSLGGTFESKDQ